MTFANPFLRVLRFSRFQTCFGNPTHESDWFSSDTIVEVQPVQAEHGSLFGPAQSIP